MRKLKLQACWSRLVYFLAAAFLGAAFLGAAAAFFGLTVLATFCGWEDLTTRPVLVLVSSTGAFSSGTAGAYVNVNKWQH
jgi:hypothetical protein